MACQRRARRISGGSGGAVDNPGGSGFIGRYDGSGGGSGSGGADRRNHEVMKGKGRREGVEGKECVVVGGASEGCEPGLCDRQVTYRSGRREAPSQKHFFDSSQTYSTGRSIRHCQV